MIDEPNADEVSGLCHAASEGEIFGAGGRVARGVVVGVMCRTRLCAVIAAGGGSANPHGLHEPPKGT